MLGYLLPPAASPPPTRSVRGWRRWQRRRFLPRPRRVGVGVVAADRGAAWRRRPTAPFARPHAGAALARAGLGELAVVGRPGDRLLGLLEFLAGNARVGVERVPDFGREGAAEDGDPVDAGHRDLVRLRVADPDRGRQVRLVAGEPGVGVFVGGPGLARLAGAAGVGGGAGAFGDVVVQQPGHLPGDRCGEHPVAASRPAGRSTWPLGKVTFSIATGSRWTPPEARVA